MTNLAFTTLLILLFAVPGYIARASYYSHEFTRQILPKRWMEDISRGFLYALPFHVVAVVIVDWLIHKGVIQTKTNFHILFNLVAGNYEHRSSEIVSALYADWRIMMIYVVSLVIFAFALGHGLRYIVWEGRLDIDYPRIFGFKNPWLYRLLRPRVQPPSPGAEVFTYVEALTHVPTDERPGRERIYRGIAVDFNTEEDGSLREIVLNRAQRGEFKWGKGEDQVFEWTRITPSTLFVIKYSEVKNLNITYVTPRPASPAGSS